MNKLYTVTEAAKILSVHPNTLRRWDKLNILRSQRYGDRGDRRYSEEDINKVITLGKNRFKGPRMKDQPNLGVCIAVFNKKEEVMLRPRRSTAAYGAGEYCFPGSRIAFGESPLQASLRILEEKVGVKFEVKPSCVVCSSKYLEEGYHSFSIGFTAEVDSKIIANINSGWKFYNINNLPKPIFDVNRKVLEAILEERKFNF